MVVVRNPSIITIECAVTQSALTCTTPNRLYLWSGTVREKQTAASPAKRNNKEVVYDAEVSWTTFRQRLEALGIGWKCYQNEIWFASGLAGEHDAWLTNLGDNPLENFTQYNVRFAEQRRHHVEAIVTSNRCRSPFGRTNFRFGPKR